jgi:glycosyltransferase involved in cell wall biosynthesis
LLGKGNVLHPTYYDLSGGVRYADVKCPVVVTVHDFIGATYPHLEDGSAHTVEIQSEAINRADILICVSQFTERELLERFPNVCGRTVVIPHGSSFPIAASFQPTNIFENPTFLFVGNRSTYKNFLFLLRSFAKACMSAPNLRLCVAGAPLTMDEKWQIHFLGLTERIRSIVYPCEDTLGKLYQQSVALLYPSRHEGFGIPPLEAMACGTLVIASNATSIPEVIGDAGILLDPTDEDAWTDVILETSRGNGQRSVLIDRGSKRAACYSWERSVEQHLIVYDDLNGE